MRTPVVVYSSYGNSVVKLAYSHGEFLAVTRSIAGDLYVIVHVPTGLVLVYTRKLADARDIMRALGGIDWNFGGKWSESFRRKPHAARRRNSRWVIAKEQTREILKRFRGRYITWENA